MDLLSYSERKMYRWTVKESVQLNQYRIGGVPVPPAGVGWFLVLATTAGREEAHKTEEIASFHDNKRRYLLS